jgi:hypothetical protein
LKYAVVSAMGVSWFLTFREHLLRMFRNGMLRRIFGAKREDGIRRYRKLHE